MAKKVVGMVAVPGVQLLDVSGPLDVFAEANAQSGKEIYQLRVIGSRPGAIQASSGVRLLPDAFLGDGPTGNIHTLLVAGAPNAAETSPDPALTAWLRETAPSTRRYGSVCSGAFFLAAAGLLDGRTAATHWAVAERLAQNYPAVTVDADAIFVRDGRVCTAAGVTAGLDLALALVEEDLGREIALQVASQLVMFFKRPGGQKQFSRKDAVGTAGRATLQEVQRWVAAHPALDHSVTRLAERMGLSPRHFARLFRQEVGLTPAGWVEEARVAAARRLLEAGETEPKQAAAQCGFANADTLRRSFTRLVGVTPSEYRRRFVSRTPKTFKPQ